MVAENQEGTSQLIESTRPEAFNVYSKDIGDYPTKELAAVAAGKENGRLGARVHAHNNSLGMLAKFGGDFYNLFPNHQFEKGEFTSATRAVLAAPLDHVAFPRGRANWMGYNFNHRRWAPNRRQTPVVNTLSGIAAAPYNNNNVQSIDPFLFKVKATYEKHKLMELTFQHSDEWTGYVVAIRDYRTGYENVEMRARPHSATDTSGLPTDYSNVHAPTGDTKLGSLLHPDVHKAEKKNEERLDAVTKIAGEGARWLCVRNHTPFLTNNSKFFVRRGGGQIWWMDFNSLWLSWASAFKKAYNIPDATVRVAINAGTNLGGTERHDGTLGDVGNADYDLTNEVPYIEYKRRQFETWHAELQRLSGGKEPEVRSFYQSIGVVDDLVEERNDILGTSHAMRIWTVLGSEDKSAVISALNSSNRVEKLAAVTWSI